MNNFEVMRSRLIMPANNLKFISKAKFRNADAIVLDLEDSVPIEEKLNARKNIKESIKDVGSTGSKVYVRVNNDEKYLMNEIEDVTCKDLYGIYLPAVQNEQTIKSIDEKLTIIEEKKDLERGSFKISIAVEDAVGVLNIDSILSSSRRIDSITLGSEDFSADSGIKIGDSTKSAYISIFTNIILHARKHEVKPMGLIGSIANYKDEENMKRIAKISYEHGFEGASCIHPTMVEILNEQFSPGFDDIKEAKNIVDNFESALKEGKAATTYNNRMIDYPHYYQSKKLLNKYNSINNLEVLKDNLRNKKENFDD